MRIHIIQHDPLVGLGSIKKWLHQEKETYTITRIDLGEALPPVDTFDLLILLGGRMGAFEEDRYPWLIEEKAFIRNVVSSSNKFILGICLGSQLIASALGGRAYKHNQMELGWHPVQFTEDALQHPLLQHIPRDSHFFEFHFDTFDIPKGASLVASSSCSKQVFTYGDHVLAVQFHPEFDKPTVQHALDNFYPSNTTGPYVQTKEQILENPNYNASEAAMFQLLTNFKTEIKQTIT